MAHIYIHLYRQTSMDEKRLGHHGKSLLHVCNSIGMLKENGISLWNDTNDFTCRKRNGNGVMIDYMLFLGVLVAFIDFCLDYRLKNQIIGFEYMKLQDNCTGA